MLKAQQHLPSCFRERALKEVFRLSYVLNERLGTSLLLSSRLATSIILCSRLGTSLLLSSRLATSIILCSRLGTRFLLSQSAATGAQWPPRGLRASCPP